MRPSYDEKLGVLSMSADLDRANLTSDGWPNLDSSSAQIIMSQDEIKFDLSGLGHIDSTGLAWLVNFKRDARIDNVVVVFIAVPDKLKQLALLSGVESIFKSEY